MGTLAATLYLLVLFPFVYTAGYLHRREQKNQALLITAMRRRIGLGISMADAGDEATANKPAITRQGLPWLRPLFAHFTQAGLPEKYAGFSLFLEVILCAGGLSALLAPHSLPPKLQLALILLPLALPGYLLFKIQQRRNTFALQLPDAIEAMVRALEAGNSIDQVILMIANEFPAPLAEEFQQMIKETQLGLPFREMLNNFRRRLPLPEVHYLVLALIIQRETGGQLASILNQLCSLMRRRMVFALKLKALTAESRFTAWFIGGGTLLYIGYRYFFNRESMLFFLTDPTGIMIFSVAIGLILCGGTILTFMLRIQF